MNARTLKYVLSFSEEEHVQHALSLIIRLESENEDLKKQLETHNN